MENFFQFRTDKKIQIRIEPPDTDLIIIKRLGKPKFWVSNNDFYEIMGKIYTLSSRKAIDTLLK
ncbi:hypothetical protein J4480_03505 [Candidatus Woesearchaeota archaeon]|nr:hypothetical protein [Candidatus Woesearchaeota archaeon]